MSIKLYQILVSPLWPQCCRFYPSCSQYAFEAVSRFGVLKGSFLAIFRLLRCHPFSDGGFDPVPAKFPGWWPKKSTEGEISQWSEM
nr:membrane protein insertion efficiency factor YidD [Thermodesulfatator autotrophicus]